MSKHMFVQGNPDVHVILRGGSSGPNYSEEFVNESAQLLAKAGLTQKIMVYTSPSLRLG